MLDPHLGEQLLVGQFLDLEHDPAEMRRERLGQAGQRGARDRLDLVERRGMIEAARHGQRHRGASGARGKLAPIARACLKPRASRRKNICGAVAEWSKALAWKVSMGQKPIEGSNPSRSATCN